MSFLQQLFQTQKPETTRTTPSAEPQEDFGSNQERLEQLRTEQEQEQASSPEQVSAVAALDISRTLRVGSQGADVEALQRFLGLTGREVDGKFGNGTRSRVMAWQSAHGLTADGIVGSGTLGVMNGGKAPAPRAGEKKGIYEQSRHHDADKFVPAFPMMAYHESGMYRTKADPYAVGTITNPDKDEDLGGKTYGVYQFESFVHSGESNTTKAAMGSTVVRFARWDKNPYGKQLTAIIDKNGPASAEFDALWRRLAAEDNAAFGKAQQDFLRHDKGAKAITWMKRAALSETVQGDDAFFDLVLGTLNHVGTLANAGADHLAALKEDKGRDLTVAEAADALTRFKLGQVESWFRSSPKAQKGIRNRFQAERRAFQ